MRYCLKNNLKNALADYFNNLIFIWGNTDNEITVRYSDILRIVFSLDGTADCNITVTLADNNKNPVADLSSFEKYTLSEEYAPRLSPEAFSELQIENEQ